MTAVKVKSLKSLLLATIWVSIKGEWDRNMLLATIWVSNAVIFDYEKASSVADVGVKKKFPWNPWLWIAASYIGGIPGSLKNDPEVIELKIFKISFMCNFCMQVMLFRPDNSDNRKCEYLL